MLLAVTLVVFRQLAVWVYVVFSSWLLFEKESTSKQSVIGITKKV